MDIRFSFSFPFPFFQLLQFSESDSEQVKEAIITNLGEEAFQNENVREVLHTYQYDHSERIRLLAQLILLDVAP